MTKAEAWFVGGVFFLLFISLMCDLGGAIDAWRNGLHHFLVKHHCKVIGTHQEAEDHWVGKYRSTYYETERDYRCDNGMLSAPE